MNLLSWSLTAAVLIHIFEEFIYPGGFKAWYRAFKPEIAASVTNRFLIIINVVLVAFAITVGIDSGTTDGVLMWIILAAVVVENAVFHIIAVLRSMRYSPGVISAAIVYIPLSTYGVYYYWITRKATPLQILLSVLVGLSYYFISYANHRRRAKGASL